MIWSADKYTGRYPPLRIAWMMLTVLPVYVFGVLFCLSVALHSGARQGWRAWNGFF